MQGTVDPDPGTEFFNGMDNGWTAYPAEHYTDTTEENRAFIAWAGSWAEALPRSRRPVAGAGRDPADRWQQRHGAGLRLLEGPGPRPP